MKKKSLKNKSVAILVAGTCFMALPVQAAEQDRSEFQLDKIVVTALREDKKDIDTPSMVHIIDKNKIEAMGAKNVLDVLKTVEGFTITSSPTGNIYVGFRGLAKDNVLILVNGISVNQQGNYNLDNISAENIERIEVVKGGSSVLYGTEATAGVVNIITKNNFNNSIRLGGGCIDRGFGNLNLQVGKLGVSYGYDKIGKIGQVTNTNKIKGTFSAIEESKKNNINVNYQFNSNWNFQYLYSIKENIYTSCNTKLNGAATQKTYSDIDYHITQMRFKNKDAQVLFYGKRRVWEFDQYAMPGKVFKAHTKNSGTNYGVEAKNNWKIGDAGLMGGIAADREKADSYYHNKFKAYKIDRDSAAAFFLLEKPLNELTTLYAGARDSYIQDAGSEFCPQFQVLHKLTNNESVYLNINKSFRAPTIVEQYGISDTQLVNPNIKPETSWSYETGWKKQYNNSSWKMALYHTEIDDRLYIKSNITRPGDANLYSMYDNAAQFKNTGIEGVFEKKLNNNWNYTLAVSYSSPKQRAFSTEQWVSVDNKLSINNMIGFRQDKWSGNLSTNYLAKRADEVSPMLNMDLFIKYRANEKEVVELTVNNLLNRNDLLTTSGDLLQQRTYTLAYKWDI